LLSDGLEVSERYGAVDLRLLGLGAAKASHVRDEREELFDGKASQLNYPKQSPGLDSAMVRNGDGRTSESRHHDVAATLTSNDEASLLECPYRLAS